MTDSNSKSATYRLFKVAAELNIGKDAIVEFLRTKGHEVADKPTTALTQEMYDIVMGKFEREHKQIEKQRKKVDAYHEKSAKIKEELITKPVTNWTAKTATKTSDKTEDSKLTAQKAEDTEPVSPVVATPEHSDQTSSVEQPDTIITEPIVGLPSTGTDSKQEEQITNTESTSAQRDKKESLQQSLPESELLVEPATSTDADSTHNITDGNNSLKIDHVADESSAVDDTESGKPKSKLHKSKQKKSDELEVDDELKSENQDLGLNQDDVKLGDTVKNIVIPEIEIQDIKEEKIYIKHEADAEEILKKYEIDDEDTEVLPIKEKGTHPKKEKIADDKDIDDTGDESVGHSGKKRKKKVKSEAKLEEYETSDGRKLIAPPPKLQGLTVLGKIEIAKNDDSKGLRGDKKKRKKIKGTRIDIERETKNQSQVGKDKKGGFGREAKVYSRDVKPNENRKDGEAKPTTQHRNNFNNQNRQGAGNSSGNRLQREGTGFSGHSNNNNSGNNNTNNKKRKRGVSVDQTEVQRAIRQTRAIMDDVAGSQRQKRSKQKRDAREEKALKSAEDRALSANILKVTEFITVAELAALMNVQVGQVIGKCIGLGLMVSINQRLDTDTIQLVADEFGYKVEFITEYEEKTLEDIEDPPEALSPRAPIVTIMGHVDHGKTSLLDYIRNANVVAGEAGGITQHIGAYSVQIPDGRKITFLDTPGHEAFTAMRARGAQVTDIVILVVAADDAVMPQTIEAISHAQAAGVPMVVAVNKIDKPESNLEKIKQQLSDRGVLVEDWGGKYGCVAVSAKKGIGINDLLERVLLEAELLDLKANPNRNARGVVVEAELDKGKGITANILVQKGTLKVGDNFVVGQYSGRIRALLDERGKRIELVKPSEPAQILGLDGIPAAGDTLVVLDSEQEAREIAGRRQQLKREQEFKQRRHITLDQISAQIAKGGVQNLRLIIKGDVDGSVEAVADSLQRLSNAEVQVSVVMKSVGEISESDVLLATASDAIIIGFHVRPNLKARKLAEQEGVDIRIYQIIYEAVNEVKTAIEGMLKPIEKEEITASVMVRDIFKISKIGTIAGCYVADGKINRNDKVRLIRDGFEVFNGTIDSLKRHKDDAKEVDTGFECGISLQAFNDIRVGDIIEAYKIVEIKRKLESAAAE